MSHMISSLGLRIDNICAWCIVKEVNTHMPTTLSQRAACLYATFWSRTHGSQYGVMYAEAEMRQGFSIN